MDLRIEEERSFAEFAKKHVLGDMRLRPYVHLFQFTECVLPQVQVYTVTVSLRYSYNRTATEIVSLDHTMLMESPAPELLVYARVEAVLLRLVKRGIDDEYLVSAKDSERLMVAVQNADSAFEVK